MRDNLKQQINSVTQLGESRFDLLDGLRGVAAAVVLFGHACERVTGNVQHFPKKHLAVYFFFMLSGFVVACAYEKRLLAGMPVLQFYLRRAIRLYPLLVLGTVLCAGYLAAFSPMFLQDPSWLIASTFSALGLPFPYTEFSPRQFPINPPAWSLFYELIAYAVFGLMAMHLRTWLLVLGAFVCAALFAFASAYYQGRTMPLYTTTFAAAVPFIIGILLWRNHEAKFLKIPPIPFWVLSAMILIVCAIPASVNKGFDTLIAATVFPVIIISGAAHGNRPSGKVMKALGDLSYPVYILHWPFLLGAQYFLNGFAHPLVVAVLGCLMALCGAWLAFSYCDVPVRRYLSDRLLSRHLRPVVSEVGREEAGNA
jgi:peptidoglycan/LPS O-acetylase OafA/YrhL